MGEEVTLETVQGALLAGLTALRDRELRRGSLVGTGAVASVPVVDGAPKPAYSPAPSEASPRPSERTVEERLDLLAQQMESHRQAADSRLEVLEGLVRASETRVETRHSELIKHCNSERLLVESVAAVRA